MAIILSFLLSLWIFRRTQQALARCAEVVLGSLFVEREKQSVECCTR